MNNADVYRSNLLIRGNRISTGQFKNGQRWGRRHAALVLCFVPILCYGVFLAVCSLWVTLEKVSEKRVEIELSKKQAEAFALLQEFNGISEVAYGGAGRGGKSWLGSAYVILTGSQNEGGRYMVGRKELKRLKMTTMATMFKFMRMYDIRKDVDYHYNAADSIITLAKGNGDFDGGSQVLFTEIAHTPSDPLYDRFGSYDLTFLWVDECQEIHRQAIVTLKARMTELTGQNWNGHKWKMPPKHLYTFNPVKNWIFHDIFRPWSDGTLEPYRAFVRALYTDNHNIDQEQYRDSILESKNQVLIQRLLYGNFMYDEGDDVLIQYDAIIDLFHNSHVLPDPNDKVISCDVALMGSDKLIIGVWYGLVLVDYQIIDKSKGPEVIEYIKKMKDKHGVRNSRIVFDDDGVGGFIDGFFPGAYAYNANARELPNPDKKYTLNKGEKTTYEHLKAQMHYKLAELTNEGKIYFRVKDSDQNRIIEEFEQIKRRDVDKDGPLKLIRKDEVKALIGRSPDFTDMCAMRMVFLFYKPVINRITKGVAI